MTAASTPLRSGRNFRDLGDYLTLDSRRIRTRRVYRSGVMSYLSTADRDLLQHYGLRTICDLRTAEEQQREPTVAFGPQVSIRSWNYDSSAISLRALLPNTGEATAADMRESMCRLYAGFAVTLRPIYRQMLDCLIDDELPLIVHCSAGKDRTGVAVALILYALGVPQDTIEHDYLLTNSVVNLERELNRHPEGSLGLGQERSALHGLPAELRAPLLAADTRYLRSAFAAMREIAGSLDAYLNDHLGVTPARREVLRNNLLER